MPHMSLTPVEEQRVAQWRLLEHAAPACAAHLADALAVYYGAVIAADERAETPRPLAASTLAPAPGTGDTSPRVPVRLR